MDAPFSSITIVGFGLIGASLALAVKQRSKAVKITAIDRASAITAAAVQRMQEAGIVDRCIIADVASEVKEAVSSSELTVLATPVRVIEETLPLILCHAQLVTDCGSTKRSIVERARATPDVERFVPGHPMAGRPRGGADSALPDLFEERRWILCPGVSSDVNLERVAALVHFVGATRVDMDSETHDLAVAVTSHVPQLFASMLAVMAHDKGAEGAAGPGFQSATRVAGGNITMWRDIFLSNADAIARVAGELAVNLQRVADEFSEGRVDEALRVLERARDARSR